jgi:hypothetical protein
MTTFRDDHEAALARLTALEAENARLVAENERLRGQPTPITSERSGEVPARLLWAVVILFGGLAALFVAFAITHST